MCNEKEIMRAENMFKRPGCGAHKIFGKRVEVISFVGRVKSD